MLSYEKFPQQIKQWLAAADIVNLYLFVVY